LLGIEAFDIKAELTKRNISCTIPWSEHTFSSQQFVGKPCMVRFAPHHFNTKTDCNKAIKAVREILIKLK